MLNKYIFFLLISFHEVIKRYISGVCTVRIFVCLACRSVYPEMGITFVFSHHSETEEHTDDVICGRTKAYI